MIEEPRPHHVDALGDRLDAIDARGCINPYKGLGGLIFGAFGVPAIVLLGQEGALAVLGGFVALIGAVAGGLVVHRYDPRRRWPDQS